MEQRRIFLSSSSADNFVDGVALEATEKGDVISFVTNPAGGLTPEFPSIPSHEVLKSLDGYKKIAKRFLTVMHDKYAEDFLKLENLPPCLKEVHRLFDLIIEIAKKEDVKRYWRQVRDLLILGLYHDTSYRWPLQYAAGKVDIEKLKLSRDDKFWFRTRVEFDATKY